MNHLSIKVFGIVQGVFFRASTKEQADALGIKGFVRNEPDDSVYIEAEADDEALATFQEWCKHGPRHAKVSKLEVHRGELKNFTSFTITR